MTIRFPKINLELRNVPRAFTILGNEVTVFGILVAIGLVLGMLLVLLHGERKGKNPNHYLGAAIFAILGGLVGGRLLYAACNWEMYKGSPMKLLAVRDGGLSLYGAILGAILFSLIYCKIVKESFLEIADSLVLGGLLAQVVGRWGDFFSRCSFGEYTDQFFAMQLPLSSVRSGEVTETMREHAVSFGNVSFIQVTPLFLFESVACFLLFIILAATSRRKKFTGVVFYRYLAWYGLIRFGIEWFRTDKLMIPGTEVGLSLVLSAVFFVLFGLTVVGRSSMARKRAALKKQWREKDYPEPDEERTLAASRMEENRSKIAKEEARERVIQQRLAQAKAEGKIVDKDVPAARPAGDIKAAQPSADAERAAETPFTQDYQEPMPAEDSPAADDTSLTDENLMQDTIPDEDLIPPMDEDTEGNPFAREAADYGRYGQSEAAGFEQNGQSEATAGFGEYGQSETAEFEQNGQSEATDFGRYGRSETAEFGQDGQSEAAGFGQDVQLENSIGSGDWLQTAENQNIDTSLQSDGTDPGNIESQSGPAELQSEAQSEVTGFGSESAAAQAERTGFGSESAAAQAGRTGFGSESAEEQAEGTEFSSESAEEQAERTGFGSESAEEQAERSEFRSESMEGQAGRTEVYSESTEIQAEKTEIRSESMESQNENSGFQPEPVEAVENQYESTDLQPEASEAQPAKPEVSKVDELLNAAVDAEAEAVAAVRTEGELSGNTGFSEDIPSLESAFQEAMDTLGSSDR